MWWKGLQQRFWTNDQDGARRTSAVMLHYVWGLNRYLNDPPLCLSWCIRDEFTSSNNVFAGVIKKMRREGRDKMEHHTPISAPLNCLMRLISTNLKDLYTKSGLTCSYISDVDEEGEPITCARLILHSNQWKWSQVCHNPDSNIVPHLGRVECTCTRCGSDLGRYFVALCE